MRELERTYLAKRIPEGLARCRSKEIIDIYIPKSDSHPKLRIRKNGDKYEMTKKTPVDSKDASHQEEQTIILNEAEFNALSKLEGKRTHKIRHYYPCNGRTAEIDVFQSDLKGLVLVDVEFETEKEKDAFEMPEFCLAEVTQETAFAGGMLCGKSYKDVEKDLKRFNYSKLFME